MSAVTKRYDRAEVSTYWSRRLEETDPLAAVLTFDAPPFINEAYHRWETASLESVLGIGSKRRRPLTGATALDIASGIGRITYQLATLGAATSAVDISPAMIRASKRKCRGLGVTFVEAPADSLPFPDRSFDIITCFGLLEHLPQGPREGCVSEIARSLRRGGRAFFVVNNSRCLFLQTRKAADMRRGYHVELVGLEWIEKAAARDGLKTVIRSANPGYAIAHYSIWSGSNSRKQISKHLRERIHSVLRLNDEISPESPLARQLASHFLVECRRAR